MLTIAVFNHDFLVQRETISALRRLQSARLVVINTAEFASAEQAQAICKALDAQQVRLVITINDWGMDFDGILADFFVRHHLIHCNWCVDDPLYYEIWFARPFKPSVNRLDLISDRPYVAVLRERGAKAEFLPLATDPDLFKPLSPAPAVQRRIAFVGNSYLKQLDSFAKDYNDIIIAHGAHVNKILSDYCKNQQLDIDAAISGWLASITLPDSCSPQRLGFAVKHFLGYKFRKQIICNLAEKYDDFVAFGDIGWATFLPPSQVSMAVGYYINLNETYQQTAVNIDINRVVIRDGFTQRVFDCLAAGAFVITSPKKIVYEFFETSGPRQEVAVFSDEADLNRQIEFYLKNEDERRAMVARGRARVLGEHTYLHRIGTMMKRIGNYFGTV